jgi:alpha-N-arabinofuranosidase
VGKAGKAFVLESSDPKAENSIETPTKVAPVEKQFTVPGGEFAYTITPQSFTVIRVAVK